MLWIGKSLLAAGLTWPLVAQAPCPYERTQEVPLEWKLGPAQTCSAGISSPQLGITISHTTVCPLFVAITPTHEMAVPSERATETVEVGQIAEKLLTYECVHHHFLFFHTSSTCEPNPPVNTGALRRLKTVGCQDVGATPTPTVTLKP